MDTLPPEIGCMILEYLEPTWLASVSMASHSLCQWSALIWRSQPSRMPRDAMEVAAAYGAWNFMRWLWGRLYWPWTPLTLATAALHNQRLVFERLIRSGTCPVDARAAAAALVGGGPTLMFTALRYGCPKSGLLTTVACLCEHVLLALRLMPTTAPDDLMNLCGVATGNWQIVSGTTPKDYRRTFKWLLNPDRAPIDLRVAARQIIGHRDSPMTLAKRLALGEIARRLPPAPVRPTHATGFADWLDHAVDTVIWENECLFSDRRQWREGAPQGWPEPVLVARQSTRKAPRPPLAGKRHLARRWHSLRGHAHPPRH
jgi:hypothetical protein